MPSDLDAMLATVHDEQTFLKFIEALGADFEEEREFEASEPSSPYGPGALGWENGTIDAFLKAAAAWGTSTAEHPPQNAAPSNLWRRCAHILYAGKFYE
jgi:hypothetical protein